MDLKIVAQEIRDIISQYQKENCLSFIEDTHTYFIKGEDGNITSDMPSVSTVLHCFYTEFVAETTRAFKNCLGDPIQEKQLLKEWSDTADYATNKGSRAHYILEKELVGQYGSYKEVRQPIFDCDEQQIKDSDQMIKAGKDFLKLMHDRGAILLDTESVLGSVVLNYFGQPDMLFLIKDKDGKVGIVICDYKTNKPKNFEVHHYTKKMLYPFEEYWDTALSHYYIQLPLYVKLLLKMLEGTKYENISFLGGIVVLLKDEGVFEEYRIPKDIITKVMDMDVKYYLEKNDLLTKKEH